MKQLTQSEIRKNGKVYKNVSSPETSGTMKRVTDIVEKDGTFSISTDGGKTYSPAVGAVPEALPQEASAVKSGNLPTSGWTTIGISTEAAYAYTISDTSITANSDILMELTDEGGVKSYSMEAGKMTVIRDTVPTQLIPYTYKVKQTNASGQFTLVNHYVPNVPVTSVNGQTGAVTIAVPTKTSQLQNDSGFITASDIPTIPTKTSQLTNDSGFVTNSAIGKGTLTIQKNGANVATFGANQSENATANISVPTKTSDLTNDSGFVTSADVPSKTSDLTNDGENGTDKFATESYVNQKTSQIYRYKGSVATYNDLPTMHDVGDVYNVVAAYGDYPAGTNFAWNGTEWDALGGSIDTSAFVEESELATIAKSGKLSDATEDATHRVVTDEEKAAWNAAAEKEIPTKTSDLTNDSGFLTKNNIVAGDNVTVTDENGNVKISATGGGSGGVTYTKLTGSVDFTTTAYTDDPYFLGQNAATWSENSAVGSKALTSTTDIGLFIGTSYTMVVNIQGTSSMFSAKAEDGSSYGLRGSKVLWFKRDDIPSQFFIYDHCTIVGDNIQAGNGCIFVADLGSDITIANINYFSGNRGVITPVTITNSAIKINSAITMYINSSLVVSGTKTDGSITLTASTEGSVSYEMEILDTSTEGLFEVINAYVPDVPTKTSQLTNDSGFITAADIPGVGEWVSVTGESTTLTQAGTYQFVTTVDKAQSIMYWDGTTAAIGTPMVGLIVNADLPEVITITPRVDADGRLTIHQSRLVKENDAWVVKGSAISSGFKYRKIN